MGTFPPKDCYAERQEAKGVAGEQRDRRGRREGLGSRTFLCRALGEAPVVCCPCIYHVRLAQSEAGGRFYSAGPDRRGSPKASYSALSTCPRKAPRVRLKASARSVL